MCNNATCFATTSELIIIIIIISYSDERKYHCSISCDT